MFRPTTPPGYLKHKGKDGKLRARVVINGKEHYLGDYGSPESHARYERFLAEWRRSQESGVVQVVRGKAVTIMDLATSFLEHAETYYRRSDGTATNEYRNMREAIRFATNVYGDLDVSQFTPLKLKVVRQKMVDHEITVTRKKVVHVIRKGLSRKLVNQNVSRIKKVFKWGVENEMVPPSIYHGLIAVEGLKRGRSSARETPDVKPVPEDVLAKTLPLLNPVLRAIVEFMLFTGCRSGEALSLRPTDVEKHSLNLWIYRPAHHKTSHHGHERIVFIGPKAQSVLAPYLLRGVDAYCFSPREAMEAFRQLQRERRKSKVQPSQQNRKKANPLRIPRERYTTANFAHAIHRACKLNGITHWHPHQLRHNAATRLVDQFGWDVARMILGHRSINVTRIYAEDAIQKAAEVMEKVG